MTTVTTSEVPHLPAYKDGNSLMVWCNYCAKWHIHGYASTAVTTHRIAHCYIRNSPYEGIGYYLDVVGEFTKELEKQYKNKRPVYCKKCNERVPPLDPVRKCPKCGKENRKIAA